MRKTVSSLFSCLAIAAAVFPVSLAVAGNDPPPASGRAFGYVGTDLDDSVMVRRTFAWFADNGSMETTFSLILPRNADRLVDTYLGNDHYVRPIEVLMAEYDEKPFLHLWGSGFPVSVWPSPDNLPYAQRAGTFQDGDDSLTVYAVVRKEIEGKPQRGDLAFTDFRLFAREVPEGTGTRMRVTDLVARQDPPDETALREALDKLRKYWTGKNTNRIFHQFRERKTPEIERQNLLVFEDSRKGVFIHWTKKGATEGKTDGFSLYMVVTDKWGYKGGLDNRERRPSPAEKDETPGMALVRGAKENNRELVASALAKGADPNFEGDGNTTPLGVAVAGLVTPDVEILRMLLEAGADPNWRKRSRDVTPLYALVQSSCLGRKSPGELAAYTEGIRLMLRHGADANMPQGLFKMSALGVALKHNADIRIVRILIEEGRGVVTEEMLKHAKDNPPLLAYLTDKSRPQKNDGEPAASPANPQQTQPPQTPGNEVSSVDIDLQISQLESQLTKLRLDLIRCAEDENHRPDKTRLLSQQIDAIQLRIITLRLQRIKLMSQP